MDGTGNTKEQQDSDREVDVRGWLEHAVSGDEGMRARWGVMLFLWDGVGESGAVMGSKSGDGKRGWEEGDGA